MKKFNFISKRNLISFLKEMKCLNDPTKYYKGDEPSPKGRGYAASSEKLGSRKKGNDGKMWQIKKDKRGVKRWVRVISEKKNRNPRIDLDLSKAGQCNILAGQKYAEMERKHPGAFFLASIYLVNKENELLRPIGHPDGMGQHCILIHIPNPDDYSKWLVIDPTYTNPSEIHKFPEYVHALKSHYVGDVDWIKITYTGPSGPNEFSVDMKDL